MKRRPTCFTTAFCATLFLLGAGLRGETKSDTAPASLTERQRILHALNRFTFGPRPGDVERVEQVGLDVWLDQQLDPQSIDDGAVDAKLAEFRTLQMPTHELLKAFYGEIKRFIAMSSAAGNTEDMKLRYGVDIKKKDSGDGAMPAAPKVNDFAREINRNVTIRAVGELQHAKIIRAAESERQLHEVMVDFWTNHFNVDVKKDTVRVLKVADDRDVIRKHALGKFRKLLGASAASPAMLVYLDNTENSAPHELSPFEQRVRAGVVKGMFGIDDGSGMDKATKPKTEGGLNENYARELLELHTLGVDGGYTQKDVEEVARCFTGWALNPLLGTFTFEDRRHDNGEKTVLGTKIPAGGGVKDGVKVLDLLARHPSTARFISWKLCRRFVADEPPASLVKKCAKTFLETDGDIRAVVRTIATSDEFNAPGAYRTKIKSPFEYAISAVRATGGRVEPKATGIITVPVRHVMEGAGTIGFGGEGLSASKLKSVNWHVHGMGQPLFACAPPTGYPEDSRKWVSSGALIARLNYALALTDNYVVDVTVPKDFMKKDKTGKTEAQVLDELLADLLHGEVTPATKATLLKQLEKQVQDAKPVNVRQQLMALVVGSPEFQRR